MGDHRESRRSVPAGLSRRRFLELTGATAATLPLFHFSRDAAASAAGTPASREHIENWEDLRRAQWTWDSVARGSHGWVNCRSACNWDLYVKDGIVVREEQTASYEASEAGLPDFNPRGCQKGACYTQVMYGPSRLTVPMKRVGKRGSGQWKRITWEQALGEIAEKLVEIAQKHGPDTIVQDLGPHFDMGATTVARNRFWSLMGASLPDDWAEIGDLNIGATLTFGFPHVGGSSDEWFLSDFLVVWMMNPAVTQIPDAHFLTEAKYAGAELVVIDPMQSATAGHASQWLPIRPGSDAALGLATARHIWQSGRIDLAYVREQTDLPLLVRLDTGRYLREADLRDGGRDNLLYLWDPKRGEPVPAPACEGNHKHPKLSLDGLEPPIEGRFTLQLASGEAVAVVPVGSLLKEHLEPWTFEAAAQATGLPVALVRRFAEGFARSERPMVLSSWGSNRYLQSDQINRTKILCLSLKGAIGKLGAGYHSTGWVGIDGMGIAANDPGEGLWGRLALMGQIFGNAHTFGMLVDQIAGKKSSAQFEHELARKLVGEQACLTNSASQNWEYQGIKSDLEREMAPLYPRPIEEYVREAREKGWMPVSPQSAPPRAWITGGSNVLRRSNLPQRMLEHMWPDLELVIDVNQKNTFTGLHADYLLPAAGYYEKPGIKYPVAYIPYLHYCDAAVEPIGEAKNEWELYWLLAQEIEKLARERHIAPLESCGGKSVDLQNLSRHFSYAGEYGPEDAKGINTLVLENSPAAKGMSIEGLERTGIAKYASVGGQGIQENLFNSKWKGEGVLQALTDMTEDKWRWPTLSGRQQFYIDHPWFLEAGEALAGYVASPKMGGDHPFQLISCHARWSIHSVWRDTPDLLRLQRGEPAVYLNPDDAARLGIGDGAFAVLANDYGEMRMRAKYATMVRPGVAYYFHAWEPHQFPDHKSYKFLIPGPIKPLHFAGGQQQLGWFFGHFEPGTHVQDTRVRIRATADSQA